MCVLVKKALEELHDESIHVRPFAPENLTIHDEPEPEPEHEAAETSAVAATD